MPANSSKMLYHDSQEILMGDVKVAKKASIEPGQRIDHTFEFQVQAISVAKELAILDAVVNSTIRPDDGDDNLSHHLNDDLVRGVIERETRALAASMTMEEMFRGTSSFINHQAVVVFGNVQLELKYLGRFILYDAYICVKKPQLVHLSEISAEDRSKQEVESIEPASKTDEIMACQSPKPLILQVLNGNDDATADQIKQQIKILSSYSLKALWFAMTMFYASLTHHYSTSTAFSVQDTLFLVAIITDAALILLLPKWGNALVCISSLLLELATCLLILSFNKYYAFAILTALLLLLLLALLQPKLRHAADKHVLPSFTQDMIRDDGEESPYVGHLLDLSQGIASFGGLSTAIAGSFMVGPVNAVGFFFFCAIALGLYLSMVVTVGAVTRPHAKCLAIVVMVLVVLTFITSCIPFVGHSRSKPQVVA